MPATVPQPLFPTHTPRCSAVKDDDQGYPVLCPYINRLFSSWQPRVRRELMTFYKDATDLTQNSNLYPTSLLLPLPGSFPGRSLAPRWIPLTLLLDSCRLLHTRALRFDVPFLSAWPGAPRFGHARALARRCAGFIGPDDGIPWDLGVVDIPPFLPDPRRRPRRPRRGVHLRRPVPQQHATRTF